MCGITGIIFHNNQRLVSEAMLKPMTDALIHRGPDDEGFHCYRNVGFGFRRLSIIDINNGHQPLSSHDKTIWIVFNGEIYNFIELKENLKLRGYIFETNSDTEVIVNLYLEYGEDCVKHLNGMFAFVIHDIRKKKIFGARDRFGIKPFFYYIDHEKFVFGSEIKSILNCHSVNKTISYDAIESYFSYGYITSDLSIYKNIVKLQPSCSFSFSSENFPKIEINKYWELQPIPDYSKTKQQWKEKINDALSASVKGHMISDVPLGAFLSGGIDSSTVVAFMSKLTTNPIKTFSIGFKEQKYNELSFAREIAKKYNTEHHELIVEPESIDLLPLLVKCYDEPFADSSAIPTYYVSKFAREFVTVALSGDGGDELFAGYNSYQKMLKVVRSNPLSDRISNLVFGNIVKLWPEKSAGKGMLYYLSQKKSTIGAYYNLWKAYERSELYTKKINISAIEKGELYKTGLLLNYHSKDFVTKLCMLDLQTYMVDDILTKVDRVSMLNSLEVRVPFLDHRFVELAFNIPVELKLNGNDKKHILKYATYELLTDNVLNHPKQGFATPLALWFKADLKMYMQDILLDRNQPLFDYTNFQYVKKQLSNHLNGNRDMSQKIWSLLFFNEWLKQNNG